MSFSNVFLRLRIQSREIDHVVGRGSGTLSAHVSSASVSSQHPTEFLPRRKNRRSSFRSLRFQLICFEDFIFWPFEEKNEDIVINQFLFQLFHQQRNSFQFIFRFTWWAGSNPSNWEVENRWIHLYLRGCHLVQSCYHPFSKTI